MPMVELLETLVDAMSYGEKVIEKMREIGRVVQNSERVRETFVACEKIEQEMIRINDRAQKLRDLWEQKKSRLDWTIRVGHVYGKLKEIEQWVTDMKARLQNEDLGDSEMSAELLLNEVRKILDEAKPVNESLLNLQAELESLTSKGESEAAKLKSDLDDLVCKFEEICSKLRNRHHLLEMSILFFSSAALATNELSAIEQELRSLSLSRRTALLSQRQSELLAKANECGNPAIAVGRTLMQSVPEHSCRGVSAKVKEMEERLFYIASLCKMCEEENAARNLFNVEFMTKYNALNSWLLSKQSSILNTFSGFGSNSLSVENFQRCHRNFQLDFKNKEPEYEAFLNLTRHVQSTLGSEYSAEAASKCDDITKLWKRLTSAIEVRLTLSECYLEFLQAVEKLRSEMLNLKSTASTMTLDRVDDVTSTFESGLRHARSSLMDLKSVIARFCDDSSAMAADPMMDVNTCKLYMEAEWSKLESELETIRKTVEAYKGKLIDEKELHRRWNDVQEEIGNLIQSSHELQQLAISKFSQIDQSPALVGSRHEDILNTIVPEMKRIYHSLSNAILMAKSLSSNAKADIHYKSSIDRYAHAQEQVENFMRSLEVLCALTATFLKNFSQVDEWIFKIEKEDAEALSFLSAEMVDSFCSRRRAALQTLDELMTLLNNEAEEILHRAHQPDVPLELQSSCERLVQMLKSRRLKFDELRFNEQRVAKVTFFQDIYNDAKTVTMTMLEINEKVVEMNSRVELSKEVINTLERDFNSLTRDVRMIADKRDNLLRRARDSDSLPPFVTDQLSEMERTWTLLNNNLQQVNERLNAASTCWTLIEEIEAWVQELTEYFIQVGKEVAKCRTSDQVQQLSDQFNRFAEQQQKVHDDKLQRLRNAAKQLYGKECEHRIQRYTKQYKEIVHSFNLIKDQLSEMTKDLLRKEEMERMKPPLFVVPLTETTVNEHSDVTLSCEVTGYPFPTVAWQKDSKPVSAVHCIAAIEDRKCLLTIPHATCAETGNYSCIATNKVGSDVTKARLTVKGKILAIGAPVMISAIVSKEVVKAIAPKFVKALTNGIADRGSGHVFNCTFFGVPSPSARWFKNGVPIDSGVNYEIFSGEDWSKLLISNVTSLDVGQFTCEIENEAGKAVSTASLQLTEPPPQPVVSPPSISVNLTTDQVESFATEVTERPQPVVSWKRPIQLVDDTAKRAFVDEQVSLTATKTTATSEGKYESVGETFVRQAVSSSMVTVNESVVHTVTILEGSLDRLPQLPVVTMQMNSVSVPEGRPVELICTVNPIDDVQICWYKDDHLLTESHHVQFWRADDRVALRLPTAELSDAGLYRCVAKGPSGQSAATAQLNVLAVMKVSKPPPQPPSFVQKINSQVIVEGNRIMMELKVVGTPPIDVTWLRNDVPIVATPDINIIKDGSGWHRLVLNNVAKSQAGLYTAVARNCCGEARCQATLQVNARPQQFIQTTATTIYQDVETRSHEFQVGKAPEIIRHLRSVCAPLGTKVTFECTVVGSPTPVVNWLFNKQPLVSSSWCQISTDGGERHMLTIREFKPEHVGLYDVVAENKYGSTMSSGRLQEQAAEEKKPVRRIQIADQRAPSEVAIEPPHFVQPLESRAVYEQEEVRFEGILTGTPEIKTVWLKDGQVIADRTHRVEFDKGKAILCIDKADFHHAGRYSCRADNAAGTAISSAVLTVKAQSTPPDFISHLISQELCEGEQLCWEVNVSGLPVPVVKWFRNGDEITSCPEFQIINRGNGIHALLVPCVQLEDTGTYTLVAENCSGEARSTADLIVRKQGDQLSRVSGCTSHVFEQDVQVDMQTSSFLAGQMLLSSSPYGFSS
ncbi:immunoglobulin I-set domain protein [Trichuris suis]|nr:immunoglobulin I-set domain protein [Trichuris suis]